MKCVIKNGKIIETYSDNTQIQTSNELIIVQESSVSLNMFSDKLQDDPRIGADNETILNFIRYQRTYYLSESDWTQTLDSPLDSEKKSAWATYRQELRDLPETYADNPIEAYSNWPQQPK